MEKIYDRSGREARLECNFGIRAEPPLASQERANHHQPSPWRELENRDLEKVHSHRDNIKSICITIADSNHRHFNPIRFHSERQT
jgi:hypothetical protein